MRNRLTRASLLALGMAGFALAGCATTTGSSAAGSATALSPAAQSSPDNPARASGPSALPSGSPGPACAVKQDKFRGDVTGYGPQALTAVRFVSPERGWVAGLDQLLMTADGGRHWTVQARGQLDLISLDFISGQVGWAVGGSALLATSDGGARWTSLPEPCPVIRSVHFSNALDGVAVAGGTGLGGNAPPGTPLAAGVLLRTSDGGHSWQPLAAPADVQTACFNSASNGWLGAHGRLYRTTDGGRTWTLAEAGVKAGGTTAFTMTVQCAGPASAWAVQSADVGLMSQSPHIGYQAGPDGVQAIFAEQYFESPGATVSTSSPGAYPGPMSALSASAAVFIDYCPPCGAAGAGTAPWAVFGGPGPALHRAGTVGGINRPGSAAFLSPEQGWVTGVQITFKGSGSSFAYRVVGTTDGGRTWHIELNIVPGG